MSHELFAHYFPDAGFHRHDDVDGLFTITTQSPAEGQKLQASLDHELFAHHVLDAGFHRHDDVDGSTPFHGTGMSMTIMHPDE